MRPVPSTKTESRRPSEGSGTQTIHAPNSAHEPNLLAALEEDRARLQVKTEQLERELESAVDALHTTAGTGNGNEANTNIIYNANLHAAGGSGAGGGGGGYFSQPSSRLNPATNMNFNHLFGNHIAPSLKQEGLVFELLRNAQETAARLKVELDNALVEKEVCQQEGLQLKIQVKRLLDDQEQQAYARRDLEGKLQFRVNQILNLEQERSKYALKEAELTERLNTLDKQSAALRSDLVAANTELRVAVARNSSLEKRLGEAKKEGETNTVPLAVFMQAQEELERLKAHGERQVVSLQTQLTEVKRRYGEISDKRVKDLSFAASVGAHTERPVTGTPTRGGAGSGPLNHPVLQSLGGGRAGGSGTATPPRGLNPPPLSAAALRAASMRAAEEAVATAAATAAAAGAKQSQGKSRTSHTASPTAFTTTAQGSGPSPSALSALAGIGTAAGASIAQAAGAALELAGAAIPSFVATAPASSTTATSFPVSAPLAAPPASPRPPARIPTPPALKNRPPSPATPQSGSRRKGGQQREILTSSSSSSSGSGSDSDGDTITGPRTQTVGTTSIASAFRPLASTSSSASVSGASGSANKTTKGPAPALVSARRPTANPAAAAAAAATKSNLALSKRPSSAPASAPGPATTLAARRATSTATPSPSATTKTSTTPPMATTRRPTTASASPTSASAGAVKAGTKPPTPGSGSAGSRTLLASRRASAL